MKFGKQLLLNAVPEWRDHYVDYGALKMQIKRALAQSEEMGAEAPGGEGHVPLPGGPVVEADVFTEMLGAELDKVNAFFDAQIKQCQADVDAAEHHLEANLTARRPSSPSRRGSIVSRLFGEGRDSAVVSPLLASQHPPLAVEGSGSFSAPARPRRSRRQSHGASSGSGSDGDGDGDGDGDEAPGVVGAHELQASASSQLVELYSRLQDLAQYQHLNFEAFRKALKKYDKNLGAQSQPEFLERVRQQPFFVSTEVEALKGRVEDLYATFVWSGSRSHARGFLEQNTRELIVFRRNVIWKDMVVAEGKKASVAVQGASVWTFKWKPLCVSVLVFVLLLAVPVKAVGEAEAQRCLAMLALLICLWVTVAIPLYVTAMLVPLLSTVLRVVPGKGAKDTAELITHSMMGDVIFLVLGGFSMASALSKNRLDSALATWIISKSGTGPKRVALAVMLVGAFLSMFLSNVAAPVLVISVMSSTIRSLPKNCQYRKALLLGIAFSCNVGGMLTPIASPQNIAAVQALGDAFTRAGLSRMGVSFGQWILAALPLGLVLILLAHTFLFLFFPCDIAATPRFHHSIDKLQGQQWFVVVVVVASVAMWCLEPLLEDYTGPAGTIAIIPIGLLYGTGVLRKEDFDTMPWNVVFLVAGGSALSKAVQESDLLHTLTDALRDATETQSLWVVTACFVLLISIATSLVSHVVGALIVLPVVAQMACESADECDVGTTKVMVLCCAFMCSGAMMLPVSSFPNVTAISCEDEVGTPYLAVWDIIKTGGPFTFITVAVVLSLGYGLCEFVFEVI